MFKYNSFEESVYEIYMKTDSNIYENLTRKVFTSWCYGISSSISYTTDNIFIFYVVWF